MKNRCWTILGAQGRCRDASGCAQDGVWTPKCRLEADLGAPWARQERPEAIQKRPQGSPETLPELVGPFPKRPQASLASPNAVGSVCGSIFQCFRWTRDGSEVRFVSLLPVFYRCRTFCASSACCTQKPRKNRRFRLENRDQGRPGNPRGSKLERPNGQAEQKSALEAPLGPPRIFYWPRMRQLRARWRAQGPRGAGGPPKTARGNFGISEWMVEGLEALCAIYTP